MEENVANELGIDSLQADELRELGLDAQGIETVGLTPAELKDFAAFHASLAGHKEVTVNFYGGAGEAAGCSGHTYDLEDLPSPTITTICEYISTPGVTPSCSNVDELARVLSIATFLVNEVPVGDLNAPLDLQTDCKIDVLPPFAGG